MADKAIVLVRMPDEATAKNWEKHEKKKAADFITALLGWGYHPLDIKLLAPTESPAYDYHTPIDGDPTWSNFMAAINQVKYPDPERDYVAVYITDHSQAITTEKYLVLDQNVIHYLLASKLQEIWSDEGTYVIMNGEDKDRPTYSHLSQLIPGRSGLDPA